MERASNHKQSTYDPTYFQSGCADDASEDAELRRLKTILNSRWYWFLVLVIHLDHLCFDNALCDVHLVTKVKEIHRVKEYTY